MISLALVAAAAITASSDPGWRSAGHVDGLEIEARQVAGSSFEEVKVSSLLARPLGSLCDAVWGRDAKLGAPFKKRVVIRESDTERWTYEQVRVPVVADRDLVIHTELIAPASSGRCEVKFESTDDPGYPRRSDHVRVGRVRGHWTLEPAADGKVEMTYTIYSEPGGRIPPFLAVGGLRRAAVDFFRVILERAGR